MDDNSDSLRVRKDVRKHSFDENAPSLNNSRSNSRRMIPLTPFQGTSLNNEIKPTKIRKMNIIFNNINIHNCSEEIYHIKLVNDIIYDEKKHLVSTFKDQLIWYETSDYLKRYLDLHTNIYYYTEFISMMSLEKEFRKYLNTTTTTLSYILITASFHRKSICKKI